jgi:hypothetical protein
MEDKKNWILQQTANQACGAKMDEWKSRMEKVE